MKILDAAQMRNIDRRATERFGVPSIVLMENAALAVADVIHDHYPQIDRAAIFCGTGQNGGDGLALARHLLNRGVVPQLMVVGDRSRLRGEARTNLEICERLGLPIHDIRNEEEAGNALVHASNSDVIVDAIFGTGLNRAPEGIYAETIRGIAEMRLPVVAIDLPSGANASSGVPFDPCLRADVTVTFAAPKHCHVFDPSATLCGEVVVADISIPEVAIDEEPVSLSLTTPRDVAPVFAPRAPSTHKGTYGHVAVVGGSRGRSGAAVLAARGAVRTGAGLVTVVTDPETAMQVHAHSVESMTFSETAVEEFVNAKDAAVVGPGLPDLDEFDRIKRLIDQIRIPLVVDASALNYFAGRAAALASTAPRILTPHPGELARLLQTGTNAVNADRIRAATEAARITGCIVVLKGHQTLVATPGGQVNVNPTGNPGMASGGMGDVLGGVIAALLARGIDALEAACAGVYLHGFAGDILREEMGDAGLAAMDLAEKLPFAMTRLRPRIEN